MSIHGILNVYKRIGDSSYDVIRSLKKITGQKKIGHLGTLDPLAEGVLPIFVGKMTKLIPYFNTDDKRYRAIIYLGRTSKTLDSEGKQSFFPIPKECTEQKIISVLQSFIGEQTQIPPMYSAIKQNGEALYKKARKGETVNIKSRTVYIYSIENIFIFGNRIQFDIHCSKGTYIRVLADDIGKALGTRANLFRLTRTQCGEFFKLQNSFRLDQIKKINKANFLSFFIPSEMILKNFHQIFLHQNDGAIEYLKNGQSYNFQRKQVQFSASENKDVTTMVYDHCKQVIAIGSLEISQDYPIQFRPHKVLI